MQTALFEDNDLRRLTPAPERPCRVSLNVGDAVEWADSYDGPPFHAFLSDTPYNLESISNRFGDEDAAPASGDNFARLSRGFMGQTWDSDIAFQPSTWRAFKRIMHPGAFGLAFGGARTSHRMAAAIEDAGFSIHPTIYGWVFASGFPAGATNIALALESTLCDRWFTCPKCGHRDEEMFERCELCGTSGKKARPKFYYRTDGAPRRLAPPFRHPQAEHWYGHRYGVAAIKPAMEPVYLFQKPYEGSSVDCILATGAGALNIRAASIGERRVKTARGGRDDSRHEQSRCLGDGWSGEVDESVRTGSWPSNFFLTHSPACNGRCVENCPVEMMRATYPTPDSVWFVGDWTELEREELQLGYPVFYHPKVSKMERNKGLETLPRQVRKRVNSGGLEHDPKFAPTEDENLHPTLKPISLTQWLASLLLPPDCVQNRRLFVPFSGVQSEVIGAGKAGWDEVASVEMSGDFAKVGQARINRWLDARLAR